MRPDRPVNVTGVYYGFLCAGRNENGFVKRIVPPENNLQWPAAHNFTDNKEEDIQGGS